MQSHKRITILTFDYPHDAIFAKSRLESEGIEVYLKDEHTVQANPLYSGAIGGVKLQVFESDLENARKILNMSEELPDIEEGTPPSNFLLKINEKTTGIPLIGHLRFELRIMIIIAIVVGLLATLVHFTTKPSISERLINAKWCVEKLVYDAKDFTPKTIDNSIIKYVYEGKCDEIIEFNSSNYIFLPGFNTTAAKGEYYIFGDSIEILSTNKFEYVYDGYYEYELDGNYLTLYAETTTIYCRKERNPYF